MKLDLTHCPNCGELLNSQHRYCPSLDEIYARGRELQQPLPGVVCETDAEERAYRGMTEGLIESEESEC